VVGTGVPHWAVADALASQRHMLQHAVLLPCKPLDIVAGLTQWDRGAASGSAMLLDTLRMYAAKDICTLNEAASLQALHVPFWRTLCRLVYERHVEMRRLVLQLCKQRLVRDVAPLILSYL
jgi:hypothetical protein